VEEDGIFYRVNVLYQGKGIPVFVTKDGKNLVQPIPITGEAKQQAPEGNTQQEAEEIPKNEKPVVEMYVMSFCPYGNEAEDTMLPVYNALKDEVDFNVNYIVSVSGNSVQSLHGQPEVDQNMREVCVREEYGEDKFWKFITYVNENCGSNGNCWEDAAQEIGADTSKIQSCVDERGLELMKEEAQKSQEAGALGSPTLIINGVKSNSVYNYGDSNSYQEILCSAFTEESKPEECSDTLESSGSNVAAGSC
jgi:glutaredoxin